MPVECHCWLWFSRSFFVQLDHFSQMLFHLNPNPHSVPVVPVH